MRYDPFDPSIVTDPYPTYEYLRDREPVYFAPETGTYVLSRHDDVVWALGDPELFSSDAMHGVLLKRPMGTGEQRLAREKAGGALVNTDPPVHTELRRLLNRAFTPRAISAWRDRISELVDSMAAQIDTRHRFDVVDAMAAPLPVRVIAELLGAGSDNADDFRAWAGACTRMMNGSARHDGVPDDEAVAAMAGLFTHVHAAIREREAAPRDDLLSTLVRAEQAGELTRDEAVGFASLLLFAGTETTTNLIANATWALLTHPERRGELLEDPGNLGAVLEETLRWESPVQYVFRRATRPFERHGVTVPADSIVTLLLGSANRDPRHWGPDAAEFDPSRAPSGSVAFGFGPHYCLGASLARAEAEVALAALMPRLDGARLVAGGDDLIDSLQFRGRRRLEVATADPR